MREQNCCRRLHYRHSLSQPLLSTCVHVLRMLPSATPNRGHDTRVCVARYSRVPEYLYASIHFLLASNKYMIKKRK